MLARVPSLPRVQQRWWQQRDQTKSSAGVRSEAETETPEHAGEEEWLRLAIPLGQRALRKRRARSILAESGLTAPTLRRARGVQTELSPLHELPRMDWQKQEVEEAVVEAKSRQVAAQARQHSPSDSASGARHASRIAVAEVLPV